MRVQTLNFATMVVSRIASTNSLVSCRNILLSCLHLHKRARGFVSLPRSLNFVCPTLELKLQLRPSFSRVARYSSSHPASEFLPTVHNPDDGPIIAAEFVDCAKDSEDSGFKRPGVIEWQKELANRVTLVGILGRDVDIKYLDSGKVVASTLLKVARFTVKKGEEDMWFYLEFWDELAEIAAAHLKKLDRIFVAGSVYLETFTGRDNLPKTLCKVTARELKYVHTSSPGYLEGSYVGKDEGEKSDDKEKVSPEILWEKFFENPSEWWDNRTSKRTPKYPDFKHKTTGESLWIDSWLCPNWVKSKLSSLDSVAPSDEVVSGQKSPATQSASAESLWQAFFANPTEWWDNRISKRNPKFPDFKHKTTGEALWIESWSSPNWVKSQLAALDSKAQTAREEGKTVAWSSGQKASNNPNSSFEQGDFF